MNNKVILIAAFVVLSIIIVVQMQRVNSLKKANAQNIPGNGGIAGGLNLDDLELDSTDLAGPDLM